MSETETIPSEFGRPFLDWLRTATERAWSQWHTPTFADYQRAEVGGTSWQRGTRWTGGLTDQEIDEVESRFGIRFPPDHRLFLQVLHATEPLCTGAGFVDSKRMKPIEEPGFYHWQRHEVAIRAAFQWLARGLVSDVEGSGVWLESWGARPRKKSTRRTRVTELIDAAPRLLPITGHRYVLADGPTLVLSVYHSDIIVYGRDLRAFLLSELGALLGIPREAEWADVRRDTIPFWGELIG